MRSVVDRMFMAKQIPLGNGYFSIVDDEDYDRVSAFHWHIHRGGATGAHLYALRCEELPKVNGKRKNRHVRMHRFILGLDHTNKAIVDHKDGDGLNNRRDNLRVTCYKGNNRNRKPRTGCVSPYKGVTFAKRDGVWKAGIRVNGEPKHIGRYLTDRDAALAYDFEARKHFGEHAYLNFPSVVCDRPPTPILKNSVKPKGGTGFKGVRARYRAKLNRDVYEVRICDEHISWHDNAESAARAYDAEARKRLGPGCYLNFPDEP